tara:strand:+ start:4094 stop:5701 length:1608 start_codon:yes stop_codon:yes gene_type:complete
MKLLSINIIIILLITACEQPTDCAGVEDGTASVDDCGICTGGTTGLESNYFQDCLGECGGEALEDNCGVCDTDISNDCVLDECGVWGGSGLDADEDGICDDIDECLGEFDDCGVCNGDNECVDCNGVLNGGSIQDDCGNCYPASSPYLDYDCIDVEVLEDFIDLNSVLGGYMPLEIGSQDWEDGRLIGLDMYNLGIQNIPMSIKNLSKLERLELEQNNLSDIPSEVGELVYLNRLYLNDNQITSLPDNLCNLPNNCIIRVFGNMLCEDNHLDCISFFEWGQQDESNCDCLGITNGDSIFDECGECGGPGIPAGYCTCFQDEIGSCPCTGLVNDLFISEYHEGSSPNQYIELYNGKNSEVDMTGYELWILRGGSNMSWDAPDHILLFNANNTNANVDYDLGQGGDDLQRVDVEPLMLGQTLMVIRDGEDEDFEFSGRNYIVWDRMLRLGGDDAIALVDSDGNIIDQIGDDEDPGSGWSVAGISGATRNHTLIRKSNIISGNTNWEESAGTNAEDSEWEVYDQDTFEDIFEHSCLPR